MNETIWSKPVLNISDLYYLFLLVNKFQDTDLESLYKYWDTLPFPSRSLMNNSLNVLKSTKFIVFTEKKQSIFNIRTIREITNRGDFISELGNQIIENICALGTSKIFNERGLVSIGEKYQYLINFSLINTDYKTLVGILGQCFSLKDNSINSSDIVDLNKTIINKLYNKSSDIHKVTSIKLIAELARKSELGRRAEDLAFEYEKLLLKKNGIFKNPSLLRDEFVNAGYDIASYCKKDSKITRKYIEVKAISSSNRFYVSSNELKNAKMYKDLYWIYLVYLTPDWSLIKIDTVQNLCEKITSNNAWEISIESYRVEI